MNWFKTRGKKGVPHDDPADPPRKRANKQRGHGSWETDRAAVAGAVSRQTDQARMRVCRHANRPELEGVVAAAIGPGAVVNTDEWRAYEHLPEHGHPHPTVNHSARPREWARDDDGDGVREVHCNTIEGLWTGVRNFLRIFRGVNKVYLQQYIAIFEWTHNSKKVTKEFLRNVLTCKTPALVECPTT